MTTEDNILILDWLKTCNSDAWPNVKSIFMKMAWVVIQRHGGSQLPFIDDVVTDLATDCALKMFRNRESILANYTESKGTMGTYVFTALKNQYFNIYRKHTAIKKRGDFRNLISLNALMFNSDDDAHEFNLPDVKDTDIDALDFIQFYCDWWHKNKDVLAKPRYNMVLGIINMLERHPDISTKRLGAFLMITPKQVRNRLRIMRHFNPRILEEYKEKISQNDPTNCIN